MIQTIPIDLTPGWIFRFI